MSKTYAQHNQELSLVLNSVVKHEIILATLSLHRTENYTLDSAGKRDAF